MTLYTDINQTSPETKEKLTDVEAIFQALENIFSTRVRERFFNQEFGIDIEDALFELLDELTGHDIFRRVTEAVQRFETRVIIDFASSDVIPDPDNNKYDVDLVFEIKGFDGQQFVYQDSVSNDQITGAVG